MAGGQAEQHPERCGIMSKSWFTMTRIIGCGGNDPPERRRRSSQRNASRSRNPLQVLVAARCCNRQKSGAPLSIWTPPTSQLVHSSFRQPPNSERTREVSTHQAYFITCPFLNTAVTSLLLGTGKTRQLPFFHQLANAYLSPSTARQSHTRTTTPPCQNSKTRQRHSAPKKDQNVVE